jgi:hypothetical protein
MGVGGQRHSQAALTPGKTPGTHSQEAGWAQMLTYLYVYIYITYILMFMSYSMFQYGLFS